MADVGGEGGKDFFALYGHEEILKKKSCPKPLVRIWNNFTSLFLVWSFLNSVREYMICRKIWPTWVGAFFTVWTSEEFFKILLLWNCLSDFKIISQDCSLSDPFQNVFAKFRSFEKHGFYAGRLFAPCGLQRNSSPLKPLVNSSLKAKKNGYSHLKNSGERSRVILALLLFFFFFFFSHTA